MFAFSKRHAFVVHLLANGLAASLFATTGCRSVPVDDAASFRVLTYNVFVDRSDFETVQEIVCDSNADVVFLQEVTKPFAPTLDALRERYPYQEFVLDGEGLGNAILSRLPTLSVRRLPPRHGWHGAWFAAVETPVGPVQLLGVHLTPPLTADSNFTVDAFLKTGPVHRKEIEDFCAAVNFDAPLVILGDFNESEAGAAGAWLKQRGLRSALSKFDALSPTWVWQGTPLVAARLDHVFYSQRLEPSFAMVIPDGSSDHRPVLTVFERAAPKTMALKEARVASRAEQRAADGQASAEPQSSGGVSVGNTRVLQTAFPRGGR